MTSLFWIVIGLIINKFYYSPIIKSERELRLREIGEVDRQYYKSKFVSIRGGNSKGSGCEIRPGYFLTALHVIYDAIVADEVIAVNDKKASVVNNSIPEDYAFLTTNAEVDPKLAKVPHYEFQEGEDIIVVGAPGTEPVMVQAAKIINTTVVDENFEVKKSFKKIYTVYIEHGISGGCVYPFGGTTPVAIITQKYEGTDYHIGVISVIAQ
jgi:hypothetical protein